MGLVLFSILLLFGLIGKPFRSAIAFCVVTAVIAAVMSVGAITDEVMCNVPPCTISLVDVGAAFVVSLVIGVGLYGLGRAIAKLIPKLGVTGTAE